MIKLIGAKRAVVIGALFAANILAASAYVLWVTPMKSDAETALNGVNAAITGLSGQISTIKKDIEEYKVNLPRYHALYGQGFFVDQDGKKIEGFLKEELWPQSGVLTFSYDTGQGAQVVSNPKAKEISYSLLATHIKLSNIKSVIDTNFFTLAQNAVKVFPAHARISKFEIKKTMPVNQENLEKLKNAKDPLAFVEGNLEMYWLTMKDVPEEDLIQKPGAPQMPSAGFRGR